LAKKKGESTSNSNGNCNDNTENTDYYIEEYKDKICEFNKKASKKNV
jgi:hypothetical protein